MSDITEAYRSPVQTRMFDGDDPQLVGYAPHSPGCQASHLQRSRRFPGEPLYHCTTSCPRRAQLDRELPTVHIDVALLDEPGTEVLHGT